ncbi:AbrB/MazE/SpoVT family DNA-binding domain-containing protein [Rhizobium sp. WL3]|uniref:AbrB/MazE/SpoVT family DNA-binding domain-containing protein n=1 Tax=Rhizobium sp. WL3 TaxID=2603277 RepID=UPI0011C1E1FF|nr:AbrB/MazE/SpoVT family DNA-binding domain-containing protein [Rhizobium sp. WL3]QEE44769.1 AbrB/MazE/SpoVT family DNA-binding domain-containing protein [Rhizobium sp. WL3]
MGAFTTMTSKGQITIPSEVRDALKLEPGTRFYVAARNGQVVAIPKNKNLMDLAGVVKLPPGVSLSLEDMQESVADAAAEDDKRILRETAERLK